MFPVLFRVGPLTLHTYGLLLAVGFFLGYSYNLALARRHGVSSDAFTDVSWAALLSGIAGARFLYVGFNWPYFADNPLEILKIWQGGLVWYGGLLGAILFTAQWARRRGLSAALTADLFAPGLALGHAVGRLGCFMAGCCFGRPSDLPWAVTFKHPESLAPLHAPLHPSQLYESALNFLLFGALAFRARRAPADVGTGRLGVAYLAAYGVIRILVETTRGDERGPVLASFTSTQWIALATLVSAAVGWFVVTRRKNA